jgi:hypothetical protein
MKAVWFNIGGDFDSFNAPYMERKKHCAGHSFLPSGNFLTAVDQYRPAVWTYSCKRRQESKHMARQITDDDLPPTKSIDSMMQRQRQGSGRKERLIQNIQSITDRLV